MGFFSLKRLGYKDVVQIITGENIDTSTIAPIAYKKEHDTTRAFGGQPKSKKENIK